ncbi:MAG: hypothetical protein D6790_18625 [Caldilineae bacterium]|nr:MAG: hypothetical protein D6790_18625 [Caldilineae bacterium]
MALRNLYAALPFPRTEPGQAGITAAMRGSTAAFYTDNRFRFRHPRSDVDIFVISPRTPRPGVRYYFYTVRHLSPTPREVDVLCFSPKRLQAEHNHPQRIFLTTKLVQPGIPIFHDNDYAQFKLESIAALVRRGLARRGEDRLTPSGAGRLVIEEDLFAEPWRWQSLQTYYLLAPAAPRHRRHLWLFCAQALSWLHEKGLACPVGETTSPYPEPVYAVEPGPPQQGQPHLLRLRTVLRFVYDQLDVLARSGRRSFTLEKATRLALKAASLRHNPRLRYDADVVFTPPGSIAPPGRPAPPL